MVHLVSLGHKYLWVDCSYHGLNPRRIHSLCPQKFLFNKIDMEISFVCIKAVQNIAFHNFFPSRATWDGGLAVKGFMEELFYQERRDWWGKSCLMCNPQRIWVITDPAGELYRSNALGAEGCWINHSWLGQDGSCHEQLGVERRVFLVWELQRDGRRNERKGQKMILGRRSRGRKCRQQPRKEPFSV